MSYDQKKGWESNSQFENQIGNLPLDHKSLERRGQIKSNWGLLYIVENIFLKAIRYCLRIFKNKLILERYERPKFWDNKSSNFGSLTEFGGMSTCLLVVNG
jgi:hypothetical protein